jgi:hypothetical protein
MGKVIKMFSDFRSEQKHNVKELKFLIEKYKLQDKNYIIEKIKKEQWQQER